MTQAVNLTTKVGSIVTLSGREWRILEKHPNKALLITQNTIGYRRFDGSSTVWSSSEIRRYLNGEFFNSFADNDKARIAESQVNTNDNITADKVFLLSTDEARKYFSSDADRIARDQDGSAGWWWLRSPGRSNNVRYVTSAGNIYIDWVNYIYDESSGVRPALWLNL